MPLLLGIPALLRFLIGLVPLFIGYVASFFSSTCYQNRINRLCIGSINYNNCYAFNAVPC